MSAADARARMAEAAASRLQASKEKSVSGRQAIRKSANYDMVLQGKQQQQQQSSTRSVDITPPFESVA